MDKFMYDKTELPTWSELYEEFYLNKMYTFDASTDTELDPYWKLPRKLVLMMQCCNQLNKMAIEKRDKEDARLSSENAFVFRLDCHRIKWTSDYFDKPTIYTIPLPTGKPNPFITDFSRRRTINPMNTSGIISIKMDGMKSNGWMISFDHNDPHFQDVIDDLMKPVIEYFSGDMPGWKNENGNLISEHENVHGCLTGFDPAL